MFPEKFIHAAALCAMPVLLCAQGGGEIHGNFQLDAQYYNPDSSIGAAAVPEKMLMNGFSNLVYTNNDFSAGLRYESYLNALQGYDSRYQGSGIPYRYASYNHEEFGITVGNFYEQFGSGLIFRSYEERALGMDNAIDGIRLKYLPVKGISVKGIWGKQRSFFTTGPGIVRGADAEVNLNELFGGLAEKKIRIIFGGSAVSKFQKDQDPVYKLPENVAAFAGRLNITRKNLFVNSEYAYKINDPSLINNYIYKPGEALLVNTGYSRKGMGITLSAKRIDNMSFRSDRTATGNNLMLNFLPALTRQHTYLLAAFYPYATQPNGEFGLQGEFIYTFQKESALGGKYGTSLSLNYSRANAIEKNRVNDTTSLYQEGTLGYQSPFFAIGREKYFEDFNIEVIKKLSSATKVSVTYLYIVYNKGIVQGLPGYGTVYAHTGILELTHKLRNNHTLRSELQHLYTMQDQHSWAMGLMEYTVSPHWFIAAIDQYNYANPDAGKRIHYYTLCGGYIKGTMRFAITYGKQRQGIFCVGGVCRTVPATNGVSISVTSSF